MEQTITHTIDSVISADGTRIGYRQHGHGEGVILVHGGMMASQNFTKLALALADTFTVYVPDRRGRGLSGSHGDHYELAREVEDIQTIIYKTGAKNIFGLSSGAIVTLQTALILPADYKVALYEPPLPVDGQPSPLAWKPRYERELAQGNLGAAMVSAMKGTADTSLFTMLPRFLLVPMLNMGIKDNDQTAKENEVPIQELIPTMHYDTQLVAETQGKLDSFKAVKSEVLLLGGNKSQGYLKAALRALHAVLPHSQSIEFKGVGHTAADNDEQPELVATELRRFFSHSPV